MAGSTRYTAVLDACVLYPAPVRDILLSLGSSGLFHARLSQDIQREWVSNLLKNRADLTAEQLRHTCDCIAAAIPDCMVKNYHSIIDSLRLPDPGDRHVLAAAIVGHADAIVTMNVRDFPVEDLANFNIEAQHPDDFILNQIELHQLTALTAIKRMRGRLRNPPKSPVEFIATLGQCQLTQTATWLRNNAEGLL